MIIVHRSNSIMVHAKGEEREDHKYIKREWKNGKWRYWYDTVKDKLGFDEKEALSNKSEEYSNALDKEDQLRSDIKKQVIRLKYNAKDSAVREKYRELGKDYIDSINNVQNTKKEVDELIEKYHSTPVGKLENAVNSGKKFIEDILGITDDKEKQAYKNERAKKQKEEKELKELEKQEREAREEREAQEERKKFETKEKERLAQESREKTEILDSFDDLKVKHTALTNDEEQAAVNPYYYTGTKGYTHNCTYCTLTYDLRKRGYDVEAAMYDPESDGEPAVSALNAAYDGVETVMLNDIYAKYEDSRSFIDKIVGGKSYSSVYAIQDEGAGVEKTAEYLTKELESHGEGSRGFLNVSWTAGSGHALVWEIENGSLIIRDCQVNKTYTDVEDLLERCSNVNYFRTDNVEPNTNALKYVRNKGDK